ISTGRMSTGPVPLPRLHAAAAGFITNCPALFDCHGLRVSTVAACTFSVRRSARFLCHGLHFSTATVCAFPLRRFALSPLLPVSCLPLGHFGGTTPFDKGEPVRQHNKTPEATPVP